jgi:hypothetical protein
MYWKRDKRWQEIEKEGLWEERQDGRLTSYPKQCKKVERKEERVLLWVI